jgi:response regulator RpfG family c-di-GMP phosphodiesterase
MSSHEKPKIMLVEDNGDASTVLAGTLYLKGCDVLKTTDAEGCLKTLTDLDGRVDVIIMSQETVGSKDMDLIIGIKKINFETKILVVGNDSANRGSIIDFGADEFAIRPMSPENMADKVLMLMAKEAAIANKDK